MARPFEPPRHPSNPGGYRGFTEDEHGPRPGREPEDSSMSWRAAGVQFYPGGAYETMQELSRRSHGDQQRPQSDSQRRGSFRGLGPKGYVRSDARLQELICERLTEDEYIDARGVSVEVKDCEVTLSGTVPVRQQKYAIEDVVAEISGVAEIHNQLSVDDAEIDERMSGL